MLRRALQASFGEKAVFVFIIGMRVFLFVLLDERGLVDVPDPLLGW